MTPDGIDFSFLPFWSALDASQTVAGASCLFLIESVHCGTAVSAAKLAGDDYSSQFLSEFNSVDALLDVSIDNKAWFPEWGYVGATNHDRLKNILKSEGYSVVSPSYAYSVASPSCE